MRLKSVAKLGIAISLSLFCIGAGLYLFGGFNNRKVNKELNLYSLVPEDVVCVIESDNINYYFNEISHLSCVDKLDSIKSFELVKFVLGTLSDFSSEVGHGLNSNMGHILISVHDNDTIDNQVLYIYCNDHTSESMDNMFNEIFGTIQTPNIEIYKGKKVHQYEIDREKRLSMYKDNGYRIVSFNNDLIKSIIDNKDDDKSIWDNMQFRITRQKSIDHNYLTLFSKESLMDNLDCNNNRWVAYNFKINSDVIYLTNNRSFFDTGEVSDDIFAILNNIPEVNQDSIILSTNNNSMRNNINEIYAKRSSGINTLFDECVLNISPQASFMMVVDGEKLNSIDEESKPYIFPLLFNNREYFKDFIISSQLSVSKDNLMHVIILTYKG